MKGSNYSPNCYQSLARSGELLPADSKTMENRVMGEFQTSQNSEPNYEKHAPADESAIVRLREERLQDYLKKALANPNPLLANLGVINYDLMLNVHPLAEIIEMALILSDHPLRDFSKLHHVLDSYLKISRQIDRYAQLELRATIPPLRQRQSMTVRKRKAYGKD